MNNSIQFNSFDSIKLPFLTPAAVCKNLFGCCGDSSLSLILDLSSKQTLTAMLRVRYVALTVWLYFYVKNRKRRFKKRPPLSPTFGGSAHIPNGHTVKLSKGNVFYRLYNEGADSFEAPFFLVHGFVGSSEYFVPLIESLLASNRRIYAIDLYGRGRSDFVDEAMTHEFFAQQIVEFLISLKINTPINLVGYSMGGGIVVHFSSVYRHLVRSLTLIAPIGLPSMTKGPPKFLILFLKILGFFSQILYGGYLHEWFVRKLFVENISGFLNDGWKHTVGSSRFDWYRKHNEKRLANEADTLPRAVTSTITNMSFDGLDSQYAVLGHSPPLPTLVLWGKKDTIVPFDPEGILKRIPHAVVKSYDDEGHILPIESAEMVGEDMQEWLQEQGV